MSKKWPVISMSGHGIDKDSKNHKSVGSTQHHKAKEIGKLWKKVNKTRNVRKATKDVTNKG